MADDVVEGGTRSDGAGPNGGTRRTLAEKVDFLFKNVHSERGEYTYEYVADKIRDAGGPTISVAYLWALRNGKRDNPTMRHLEALSAFFGVPASYFFDDEVTNSIAEQVALVAAVRNAGLRKILLRGNGVSEKNLQLVLNILEQVRQVEGLPAGDEADEGKSDL